MYASVGCTYFVILEPRQFNPQWFSDKFKGPCLVYQVPTSVTSNRILCCNGLFVYGNFPDIKTFYKISKIWLVLKNLLSTVLYIVDQISSLVRLCELTLWSFSCSYKSWDCERMAEKLYLSFSRILQRSLEARPCFFAVLNIAILVLKAVMCFLKPINKEYAINKITI